MDYEPNYDAFDCYDSGDPELVEAREAHFRNQWLTSLKQLESVTRAPEALDEDTVERWRLFREALSELIVVAIQDCPARMVA